MTDPFDDLGCSVLQYKREPKAVSKRLEEGRWHRASARCLCSVCGEEYGAHSLVQGVPWLHQLCDGSWIKP